MCYNVIVNEESIYERGIKMEVRIKKTKFGTTWKLVNETWETSNAWGHKTTIIRNLYSYKGYKVRYYNRTWEVYAYQTCMSSAVRNIYEEEKQLYINNYKIHNNIVRFKKGQKEEVIKLFEQTESAQELQELQEAISNRNFD